MAFYTFYCGIAEAPAAHLEARELADDAAARRHAAQLLVEHKSFSTVQVMEGDRELAPVHRAESQEPVPALDGALLQRLRTIDEQERGLAVIATSVEGVVLYWNDGARALYGWSRAEALGRNILDLTPALQSRSEATSIMQSLRSGLTWQGEIVVRRRDGTPFSAFVADIPVGAVQEGRGAIVGLSVKASERRRLDVLRSELEALADIRSDVDRASA